jgi:hypothetical protein
MATTNILEKAKAAPPPTKRKGKWGEVMPVIRTLLERQYDLSEAVNWCVAEGAIPEASKRTAYYAISNRLRREAKKAAQTKQP